MMDLYPYEASIDNNRYIFLWVAQGDGADVFVTKPGTNTIICTSSVDELKKIASGFIESIHWDEGAKIDFDDFWKRVGAMRTTRASSTKTCQVLLEGWNFLSDLARTSLAIDVISDLDSAELTPIYQKLFLGNNLEAITPIGESYNPTWTKDELRAFRASMRHAWRLIKEIIPNE